MHATPAISLMILMVVIAFAVVAVLASRRWGRIVLIVIGVALAFSFLTAFVSFRRSAAIHRDHTLVIGHRGGRVQIRREIDEFFPPRIQFEVAPGDVEVTVPRLEMPPEPPEPVEPPQPAVAPEAPDAVDEPSQATDQGLPPEPAAVENAEAVVVEAAGEAGDEGEELPESAAATSEEVAEAESSGSTSSSNHQVTPALPVSAASSRSGSAKSAEAGVSTSRSAADRPAWTNEPSGYGEDETYRRVVVSDPWKTEEECDQELREKLMVAVAQSIGELMDAEFQMDEMDEGTRTWFARSRLRDLDLSMSDIQRTIVAKRHLENYELAPVEGLDATDRTMKRKFLLLEFDRSTQVDIEHRWEAAEQRAEARQAEEALYAVCGVGSMVLAALGLFYGLLRFDTATKGYYTKRLLIGVGAMTILFVLLAFLATA